MGDGGYGISIHTVIKAVIQPAVYEYHDNTRKAHEQKNRC
jgi:hypothetical protein